MTALTDRTGDAFAGVFGPARGHAKSAALWQVERAEADAYSWDRQLDQLPLDGVGINDLVEVVAQEGVQSYLGHRFAARAFERLTGLLIAERAPATTALNEALGINVEFELPGGDHLSPTSDLMRCAAKLDTVDLEGLTGIAGLYLQDRYALQAYQERTRDSARRGSRTEWRELAPRLGAEAYAKLVMTDSRNQRTLLGLCYGACAPGQVADPETIAAALGRLVTAFGRSLVDKNAGSPENFGYTYPSCWAL